MSFMKPGSQRKVWQLDQKAKWNALDVCIKEAGSHGLTNQDDQETDNECGQREREEGGPQDVSISRLVCQPFMHNGRGHC